jgi:hypothetical protein
MVPLLGREAETMAPILREFMAEAEEDQNRK